MTKTASRILLILVLLFMVFTVLPAQAKPFLPLNIPNYSIDIPDNVKVPDRGALVLREERVNPSDTRITMYMYGDPEYVYYRTDNNEMTYPYIEIIMSDEGRLYVLCVAFINQELEAEVYKNALVFGSSIDKLIKSEHKINSFKKIKRF